MSHIGKQTTIHSEDRNGDTTNHAIQRQTEIGWTHFLQGHISIAWKQWHKALSKKVTADKMAET